MYARSHLKCYALYENKYYDIEIFGNECTCSKQNLAFSEISKV